METIYHRIKAYLYRNLFTPDPNDYIARGVSERSLGVREICQSAVTRGQAKTTVEDMEYNINLFLDEMAYLLCDGYAVNTGYFKANNVIRGVFGNPQEKFDRKKHKVIFKFKQGHLLKEMADAIEVDVVGLASEPNYISQVTDVKSGSVNNLLTPNRILRINGVRIKIAGEDPEAGIYFINQQSDHKTKVDVTDVVTNYPSEISVIVPQMIPGRYKLEIKTQFTGSFLLKDIRTITFLRDLSVQ